MSWWQRAAQAKPMALPFPVTRKNRSDIVNSDITNIIDEIMTPETARRIQQDRAPEFLAAGCGGTVATIMYRGKPAVEKFICNETEATVARNLIGKSIPCVVQVYDVKELQEGELWSIIAELVKPLSGRQKKIAEYIYFHLYDTLTYKDVNTFYWAVSEAVHNVQLKWHSVLDRLFIKTIEDFYNCLLVHGVHTKDTHDENLGWTDDGRLVLFDLGESSYSPE